MKVTAAIISDEHHVMTIEYKPTWWRKLLRLPTEKTYVSNGSFQFWFRKHPIKGLMEVNPITDSICDMRWQKAIQRQRLTCLSQ